MIMCRYLRWDFGFYSQNYMLNVFFLTAFLVFVWVVPLNKLKNARLEFSRMVFHYFIGPFGEIAYRNLVMASAFNTLLTTMVDFTWLICLYSSGSVLTLGSPTCSMWLPFVGDYLRLYGYFVKLC
jgi:hypothetical protein